MVPLARSLACNSSSQRGKTSSGDGGVIAGVIMFFHLFLFFRLFFSAEWQTLLDVRSFTGKRKDEFTLISRQVCHSAFFLAIRRLRYVTPPNVRSIPRKLLRSSEARSISSRRSSE